MMSEDVRGKKAVFLPAEIYERIEERVRVTEFNSVDEYVAFVLEEVLKAVSEESADVGGAGEEVSLSEEEEEEVKRRLRALGYLE
ncbi:MAG: hypothetical protein OCU22_09040 [Canidatus Methanoxibalbensis ujae]|nr:hypothetical protein [Candidatus Methanoxibalbensis ujae]